MPAVVDPDLTLPSAVSALPGHYNEQQLVLTIIFHPDTSRIGQAAPVPGLRNGDPPWILGRRSPAFVGSQESAALPLVEPHVSRRALSLSSSGNGLAVRRLPASSRCRIAGAELDECIELSQEQLQQGVPLLLGHSVVLLMRLVRSGQAAGASLSGDFGMRGGSTYMAGLREQITQVARSSLDVLIRGETGTGKELVAAAIHRNSDRASGPLISVNMTAIPAGLGAATLFGSARGAFTGAHKASDGYFLQAEGGTLFLDEIGDTPAELQPQLLRALQQREIQLVGGPIRRANVRVISATDADLEADGCGFRAALRHRLGGCEVRLAPLREHPEDIGELLLHFLVSHNRESGLALELPDAKSSGREVAVWAELFHKFLMYHWPGNVRELANFAGQVVVASNKGLALPDSVERALLGPPQAPVAARPARRKIRDIGEAEFANALQDSAYEVAQTARQLGVSRQAVYRRLEASLRYRLAEQVPQAELQQALARHNGDITAAALELEVSSSSLRNRLRAARRVAGA